MDYSTITLSDVENWMASRCNAGDGHDEIANDVMNVLPVNGELLAWLERNDVPVNRFGLVCKFAAIMHLVRMGIIPLEFETDAILKFLGRSQ